MDDLENSWIVSEKFINLLWFQVFKVVDSSYWVKPMLENRESGVWRVEEGGREIENFGWFKEWEISFGQHNVRIL